MQTMQMLKNFIASKLSKKVTVGLCAMARKVRVALVSVMPELQL